MGQSTDAALAEFASESGIHPARGTHAEVLERMKTTAADIIEVVALERAGIRDGDGYWHGADPVAALVSQLAELDRKRRAA